MSDPVIVDVPAQRVVGIVVISTMEPNLCPTAWDELEPRISEIRIEGDCLGVVRWDYPELPAEQFAYMAGFESSHPAPTGMEVWDIPGGKYAKVQVNGLDTIRPTIGWFMETWLPQSGFTTGPAPYLELYPETFPDEPTLFLLFSVA